MALNSKPGIRVEIPGFGPRHIEFLVTDYTGTLACGGKLSTGAARRIIRLAKLVETHVLTADTFGTAARELAKLPLTVHILEPGEQDLEKQRFVAMMTASSVAAFGNGNNDRLMLRYVKDAGGLAVAVDNGEGCALETLLSSNLSITGIGNALDLLLEPDRLKATLRF